MIGTLLRLALVAVLTPFVMFAPLGALGFIFAGAQGDWSTARAGLILVGLGMVWLWALVSAISRIWHRHARGKVQVVE